MCSNKKPRVGEGNCNKAKLEVTCQPEETTFRDEGGRFNYLFASVVLRTGVNGLPIGLGAKKKTALHCTLEYEDGTQLHLYDSKPALRIYGNIELGSTPKEGKAYLDCQTLCGSVRYKIQKLSRNHDARRFRIRISLEGTSESVVQSAVTRPTMVLSKRKWLKAEDRSPEMDMRNHVEELADAENLELGKLAGTPKAQASFDIDIRTLAGLKLIEKQYPEPSSLSTSDSVSLSAYGSSSSGSIEDQIGENESIFSIDDCKDSDDEYKPGPSTRSSKRSLPRSKRTSKSDRSSSSERMFKMLMSRLDTLQGEVSAMSSFVKRFEKEHEELKRKVEASESSPTKRVRGNNNDNNNYNDDEILQPQTKSYFSAESRQAQGPTSLQQQAMESIYQDSYNNNNNNNNMIPLQPTNVVRSTSQLSLPLSLPRLHSLGVSLGEESFPETFTTLFQ